MLSRSPAELLAVLALVLLAAGCGDKTSGKSSGCSALAGGSTAAQSGGHPSQTMLLTDVQPKADDKCTDRIAFDFRPDSAEKPGYRVEYRPGAEAKVEDGSGRVIPVAGSAFLVVRLEPSATADLTKEPLEFTYKGPRRITPTELRHVQEIVKTGDFEGVVTWVIGLDGKRPFKATGSTSPSLAVVIG